VGNHTNVTIEENDSMAKFLFIYRDPAEPASPPSPEQMQAFLAMWGDWFQKYGTAILDGGDGLHPTGKLLKTDGTVSDGPYVESKEIIGGFSVVQCDNYDLAVGIARDCPIAKIGGTVEIREFAGFN
jgi:hypothetical protein